MGAGASKKTQGEVVEATVPAKSAPAHSAAPGEGGAEVAATTSALAAPAEREAPASSRGDSGGEEAASPSPVPGKPPMPEKPKAAQSGARRPRPGSRGPKGAEKEQGGSTSQPGTPRSEPATPASSESPTETAKGGKSPAQSVEPKEATPQQLVAACRSGDLATVRAHAAAKAGQLEAFVDADGNSALHHAVEAGQNQIISALLQAEALPVDTLNPRCESALQVACSMGHRAMAERLLQAGADPDHCDARGFTPLLSGIHAGASEELLDLLLQANADVNASDICGVTALHLASLGADANLAGWLLKHGAKANMQTVKGATPLMLAVKSGSAETAVLLHQAGADLAQADVSGTTVLMQALLAGDAEAVQQLLGAGASPMAVDGAGRSCVLHAVHGGNVACLEAVIARGGRVNMLDEDGRSPLYQACVMGSGVMVKVLLDAKADPNLTGRGSCLPSGTDDAVERQGSVASVRTVLEQARTCLQVAVALGHEDLAAALLDHGADANAAPVSPGALGWTPLHICAACGNEAGATLLLSRGASATLKDCEGNTADVIAERTGQNGLVSKLRTAAQSEPRRKAPGALPALGALPEKETPEEELVPLAAYEKEWRSRASDDTLLDRAFGPMVHDALGSADWRVHWEALEYLSKNFAKAAGTSSELTAAVSEIVIGASKSKMPKVFLASLAVLEVLLKDPRVSSLGHDEFTALFRGRQMALPVEEAQAGGADGDALLVLFDQAEESGGSSKASSPQQAAVTALCSCIQSGKLPVSEAAWALMSRADERLRSEAAQSKKDKKEAALGPKCLATNFRVLCSWMKAFGLQSSGLFRRALVLPLLLRGLASEHSKVRAAAGEALVQVVTSGGDLEEKLWELLPSKRRKAAKELLADVQVPPGKCQEDAVSKKALVAEDARARGFVCTSELTAEVWASLQSGKALPSSPSGSPPAGTGATLLPSSLGKPDEGKAESLRQSITSKSWKDRCDSIARISEELTATAENVKLIEGATPGGSVIPQLGQYVLCGYQVSLLQSSLVGFLGDSVTAVFIAAADLLQKVCERVPVDLAVIVWEPSMAPLAARLPDTSAKVRAKAAETILAVAGFHAGALGEAVAMGVAGTGSGGAPPQTSGGTGDRAADLGRGTGPRLQLLSKLIEQAKEQDAANSWTEDTWATITGFASLAAQHRSADVRQESALLLSCCGNVGGRAASAAEGAMAQLQAGVPRGKRPGTASGRPKAEGMTVTSTTYGGGAGPGASDAGCEMSEEEMRQQAASKDWKERAACLSTLGRQLTEGSGFAGDVNEGDVCLSTCTLGCYRASVLQSILVTTLGDTVTGVFAQAAGLLQVACGRLPPSAGRVFLEPLLSPLLARLQDTSTATRSKAVDVSLAIAAFNNHALGEFIAAYICGEVTPSIACPPTPGGAGRSNSNGASRDSDRNEKGKLQLLVKLLQLASEHAPPEAEWAQETCQAAVNLAVKAAEHRNADVRKESAAVLSAMSAGGGNTAVAAEAGVERLKTMATEKMCKRPGTGGGRLGTASGRSSTSLGASGRLSTTGGRPPSLGASGRQPSLGSTSRMGTASFRPSVGGSRDVEVDSDDSMKSQAPPNGLSPGEGEEGEEDGVKFYNVQTACPGADVVPDLEEGEAAMKEALQLAEPLAEESRDFVAPLVSLFGEGWVQCFYSKNWQCRVAALTHLAASMSKRLEEAAAPERSQDAAGELLSGATRAAIEGLSDQNVRVYSEACMATTAIVPAFTTAVDGRLLVSSLAPLLRLLCTRMGDLKEAVRTQTTQALFRLLRPPVGDVLSPGSVAVLILRHLVPSKQDGDATPAKGSAGKGAAVAWLCRLAALRDLVKEYPQASLMQPGTTHPGEWLRLQAGLGHSDPTVRHESARLLALACKMHLRGVAAEVDNDTVKEAWVAALQDVPPKALAQVRKLLKLPERTVEDPKASTTGSFALATTPPWEVPANLVEWTGCGPEVLHALRAPIEGAEASATVALRALTEACVAFGEVAKRRGATPEEAFAGICRAVQQCLASPVGADRAVFLGAVGLCQASITHLSPALSGLDINMGLTKMFPTLMERASLAGAGDVRLGVAADKLVQQLAKHPKVGAEAVTKMVVNAVSRSERPVRPLVLLRTLLNDFGLRLCAQRDIVSMLLSAIGVQLERLGAQAGAAAADDSESLRPQLVGVLATCSQFSMDTVRLSMGEMDPSQRKLLSDALREAPDPRLVALGAAAADPTTEMGHVAGSGSGLRALSRSASRGGLSEKSPDEDEGDGARRSTSRRRLPRPEDEESPPLPGGQRRRRRRYDPTQPPATGDSEASTASTMDVRTSSSLSPAHIRQGGTWNDTDAARGVRSAEGPPRPPAPLGLSTLRGSRGGGIPMPRPVENGWSVTEGEGMRKPVKGRSDDGLAGLMDVLSQMEGGSRSRAR